MKCLLRWCVVLLMAASSLAQTAPAKKKATTKTTATGTVSAADVQELKNALAAQQQQIRELKSEMQRRDAALQQAQRPRPKRTRRRSKPVNNSRQCLI